MQIRSERKLTVRVTVLTLCALVLAACGSDAPREKPPIVYRGDDGGYQQPTQTYPDQDRSGQDSAIPPPVDMGTKEYDTAYLWGRDRATEEQSGGVTYLPGAGPQPQRGTDRTGDSTDGADQGGMYDFDFTGLGSTENDVTLQGSSRIALLVPLSGPHAHIGQALYRAAQMALFAHGERGVVLLPRDTQGRPDVAALMVRQAAAEGADLILGPLFSHSVSAAAPEAKRAGLSMIAFSNNRDVAQPGVFLLGFLPEQQVTRVVRYASGQGLHRFAGLFPDTNYGRRVAYAFHDAVSRAGSAVTKTEVYYPEAQSMFDPVRRLTDYDVRVAAYKRQVAALEAEDTPFARAALERLKDREAVGDVGFDAVLLPEGGTNLKSLAPLLPYYEVNPKDVKFLGTGLWGEAGVGLEPALVGGWYAGPPPAHEASFAARYEAVFGDRPPRLASLGFDAMSLSVALHKSEGGDSRRRGRYSARSITRPQGFAGMDGIFRFHDNGLNERGLAVIEVLPTGTKVIDPAPDRFIIYDAKWQQDTPEARARQRLTPQQGDYQQPYFNPGFGRAAPDANN